MVEILLDRRTTPDAVSILVLDRQHVFELLAQDGGDFRTQSVESIAEQAPGALRLRSDGTPTVVELAFTRAGDPCDVRLTFPSGRPRLVSEGEAALRRQRLLDSAQVARLLQQSNRLMRPGKDAKAARVPGQAAFDAASSTLGPDHPLTAAAAEHMGSVYWRLGDNRAAHDRAEAATAGFTRAYGADSADALEARKNLALYVWELGDLATTRMEFERLRPLVLARFGERSNVALSLTANLATLYAELGLLQEALDTTAFVYLAREARDGPNNRNTLIALNNLATQLSMLGRLDDARRLYELSYQRHRDALGPRDPDTLRAQHNIAFELCSDTPPDCSLMHETVRTKTELLGPDHPVTIYSRQFLGAELLKQQRYNEALQELEALYRAQTRTMGARHWWTMKTASMIAEARVLSGDAEAGLTEMKSVVASFEEVLGPTHWRTLRELAVQARMCEQARRPECQRSSLELLVERAEGERGIDVMGSQQRLGSTRALVPYYRTLAELQARDGDPAQAVRTIEQSKSRALLVTLALKNAERVGGLPQDAVDSIAVLERELAALDDERNRPSTASERLVRIEARQSAIARELGELRAQLRDRYPRYAAATQVDIPAGSELTRSLAANEIFIGYAAIADGFLVYTADSRANFSVHRIALPGARSTLEAWRSAVGQTETVPLWLMEDGSFAVATLQPMRSVRRATADEIGRYLATKLLGPVLDRIAGYSRWVISPDGTLATLPFETLPWQVALLAARVEVRYVQSLAVYRLLRHRAATAATGLLAMGGPTFEAPAEEGSPSDRQVSDVLGLRGPTDVSTLALRSGSDPQAARRAYFALGISWSPLPGAAREARAVAALFRGAAVYTGNEASEERLQQLHASGQLAGFRYLLFATHGYLSTDVPALSSVVLRQPGSVQADGYVTAAEWAGYSLRSELTVLSACETGLGKEVAGEGVMGLPYALFVAGNRNTLLSLWKVPDASTSEFMIRFFRKLRAGVPQSAALAQTRHEMMKLPRYRDPIHWAGFVLYGS
jgi:CHAT domain-containing protein/tetratricopeptide (TPR) repeat protein